MPPVHAQMSAKAPPRRRVSWLGGFPEETQEEDFQCDFSAECERVGPKKLPRVVDLRAEAPGRPGAERVMRRFRKSGLAAAEAVILLDAEASGGVGAGAVAEETSGDEGEFAQAEFAQALQQQLDADRDSASPPSDSGASVGGTERGAARGCKRGRLRLADVPLGFEWDAETIQNTRCNSLVGALKPSALPDCGVKEEACDEDDDVIFCTAGGGG